MEELPFLQAAKLLCYTDDLALYCTGPVHAQRAKNLLTGISTKCKAFGLKFDVNKSTAFTYGGDASRTLLFSRHTRSLSRAVPVPGHLARQLPYLPHPYSPPAGVRNQQASRPSDNHWPKRGELSDEEDLVHPHQPLSPGIQRSVPDFPHEHAVPETRGDTKQSPPWSQVDQSLQPATEVTGGPGLAPY